jgi:hypothetical protein
MYTMKRIVLGFALSALLASPTLALTINNRDTSAHTVQFAKGDKTAERSLASGELLKENCVKGCVVHLAGSNAKFNAKDNDALMVKDGKIQKDMAK